MKEAEEKRKIGLLVSIHPSMHRHSIRPFYAYPLPVPSFVLAQLEGGEEVSVWNSKPSHSPHFGSSATSIVTSPHPSLVIQKSFLLNMMNCRSLTKNQSLLYIKRIYIEKLEAKQTDK